MGRSQMSEPVFTVANQLTLLRMALVPALVVLALSRRTTGRCGVFALAGVTDLLDGFIARLGQQQTTLGAMLDPVADKLLLALVLRGAHLGAAASSAPSPCGSPWSCSRATSSSW